MKNLRLAFTMIKVVLFYFRLFNFTNLLLLLLVFIFFLLLFYFCFQILYSFYFFLSFTQAETETFTETLHIKIIKQNFFNEFKNLIFEKKTIFSNEVFLKNVCSSKTMVLLINSQIECYKLYGISILNSERTMRRDGQKWLILIKLILKNTSYEDSFMSKIKKIISHY